MKSGVGRAQISHSLSAVDDLIDKDSISLYSSTDISNFETNCKPVLDYMLSQADDGECPYVRVRIYDICMNGLLDSGANKVFINEYTMDTLQDMGVKLQNVHEMSCTVANNEKLNCLGFMLVPIKLKGKTVIFEAFVLSNLRHNLVLGTDFWIKMGIIPDLKKGEWYFSGDGSDRDNLCINSIQTADDLSSSEKKTLNKIIDRYFDSVKNIKLGCTNLIEHKITLNTTKPVKLKNYPVSHAIMRKIDEEITKMLELGVIEKSNSSYSSPVLMIPKKDNSLRFCVDLRKINEISEKWAYPLPNLNSIIDRLGNAKYLTTLDIQSAYWQIKMHEGSKQYTAFSIPGRGIFHFNRMPFGLTNAPATFQALVDKLLGPELEPYCFKYLDDIVIVTPDAETHFKILEEVLERLLSAGLTLNRDKCQFCRSELKFLGYVINRQGLHVDPEKVSAIVNMPRPVKPKEVRRILGMISFYRRFVPNLSTIITPLTNLTRKNAKFVWTSECEKAFQNIKNCLISPPILSCPNFNEEFIVECDASSYGLGAVISQHYNNQDHVICYLSRTLTKCEKKYTVTELECLSVIWAVEKARCYLEGTHFTVITDHYSLLWLHNLKNPQGRLGRWALRLQAYDFTIKHKPGKDHKVPDCLSRQIKPLEMSNVKVNSRKLDKWYTKMRNDVISNPLKFPNWRVSGELLYKNTKNNSMDRASYSWKTVVPKYDRNNILKIHHDDPLTGGHLGIFKTYNKINNNYFWPGMKSDIRKYVNACKVCCEHKPEQRMKAGMMGEKPTIVRCWQYVASDLIGPLPRSSKGNQFILVYSDYFSKFSLFFPLRKATASKVSELIEQTFLIFGVPEFLKSDNGVQYTSKEFTALLKKYNVKSLKNPLYHPEPNFTERVNRVFKTMISCYVKENHKKWDQHLYELGCAYRTAKSEVTGMTPYYINFGSEMVVNGNEYGMERAKSECNLEKDVDNIEGNKIENKVSRLEELRRVLKEKLKTVHEKSKHRYNLRHRPVQFQIGDYVWKKEYNLSDSSKNFTAKLGKKYGGPFRVKRKLGINVYELEDDTGSSKGNWHIKDLKLYESIC